MRYAKLIFKNAKRSAKDYLVYVVTMTICVTLFYAFLSVSSSFYRPDIGAVYDVTMLGDSMKMAICAITLVLLFLIRYVNNYMLRCRQKEFGLQSVMGMEQKTLGRLFFAETFLMGALSIGMGILLGVLCSQFITAMLLSNYGRRYELTWTLFPDTVLWTVGFFAVSLFVVGLFNVRRIRKIKIIDMLRAERQNEPALKKSRFMPAVSFLYFLVLAAALLNGIWIKHFYFDSRLPIPAKCMFLGNILAPALGLLWPLAWRLGKKRNFHRFVAVWLVCSLLCAIAAALVPQTGRVCMLAYNSGVNNQYLTFLLLHIIYLICGVIFLANTAILFWKERRPEYRYKGLNLFLLGQITTKLTTNTKTMILICLTLTVSICLFVITPVLTGWASGYLDVRSMYDVQISTRYNNVYDPAKLYQGDFEPVTKFLEERGIETKRECTFSLYLPVREDFHSRIKYEFPVAAISLGDYNALREMLGYAPVTLEKDEFTTQWKTVAEPKAREEFLRTCQEVDTDAGNLTLSADSLYEEPIGMSLYNSYTDLLYVFPDEICQNLLPVNRCRFIETKEPLTFEDAEDLEEVFVGIYPEDSGEEGMEYILRMNTLQVNESKVSNFVLQAGLIYGAVVLMVICLTILSLQQLLDAGQFRYRFSVLRRLGVEEGEIKSLVLKQLGVWFGLPVAIAAGVSGLIITCFMQAVSAEISAYIGAKALLGQVAVTASILMFLLICYFISTWLLFEKSIAE